MGVGKYICEASRFLKFSVCLSVFRVASGVSNIIDHTLTKRPIIYQFLLFSTFHVSPVKFYANTIETDNLENFLCTLYRD